MARRERVAEAVELVRRAVAELEATAVYPTLLLLARALLATLGVFDPEVSLSAATALRGIEPAIGDERDLDLAARQLAARLVGIDESATYRAAAGSPAAAAGFYNRNIRVAGPFGPVNVRIPVDGADMMDLHLWPEPDVLRAIEPYVPHAPRLRSYATAPRHQVQNFVEGELLDGFAPRGVPVPHHVITDVAALFAALRQVPRDALPPAPGWPEDPVRCGRTLSELTRDVHRRGREEMGPLYRRLGIPEDPLAPVEAAWPTLSARSFRLVHADVHRKNMIVDRSGARTSVLDWELALWADPLLDIALHLHKMGYQTDERAQFLDAWQAAERTGGGQDSERDLATYLDHEKVKSSLVDAVRYAKLIRAGIGPDREQALVTSMVAKIIAARAVWGDPAEVDPDQVTVALRGTGT